MLPAALRMQNIGRTECGVPTPGEPRRHEDGGKFSRGFGREKDTKRESRSRSASHMIYLENIVYYFFRQLDSWF